MSLQIFLKIEGVKGDSKIAGHEDQIEVSSWGWAMHQDGTMHYGGGGGAGKVDVTDISIDKYVDKATPALLRACCNGKHFGDAELVCKKMGGDALVYFRITMSDIMVTDVRSGASEHDERQNETIQLQFAKFECAFTPQKSDGGGDAEEIMNWNIETNKEE